MPGFSDMDPEEAAAFATADPEGSGAGGGLGGSAGPNSMFDLLKRRDPHTPIQEVGNFRDIRQYWASYGLRAIEKMAGADDAWAGIDLAKFGIGAILNLFGKGGNGGAGGAADVQIEGVDF